MTLANRQHEATHGLSQPRDLGIDYTPIPNINQAFDNQGPQMSGLEPIRNYHEMEAECNRQFAFNVAKQAKLDAIRAIAEMKLRTTTNMEVHAAMNSVIHVLGKE